MKIKENEDIEWLTIEYLLFINDFYDENSAYYLNKLNLE